MSYFFKTLPLVVAFLTMERAVAQDSLSIRDAAEIRYKAGNIVERELRDLLNAVSSTTFETQETAELIHNAYSEGRNRIFRDSAVLVEPDVNPAYQTSGQSGDEPLDKYLRDMDILYKKSDSNSIAFSNIRCSNVKKKDIVYVKVYFNSFFRNASTVSEKPYAVTNRIAEIKAEKDKNQWRLYIVRLGFFNPADTGNDVANNIPLKMELNTLQGLTAKSTAQDTAAAIQKQLSFDEEQSEKVTKQLVDKEKQDDEQFRKLLVMGDQAGGRNEFTQALQYYKNAQDIKPNNIEVNARIKKTMSDRQQFTLKSDELYTQYLKTAALQVKNRQYKEAIQSYQDARNQKPVETASIDSTIRILTVKYRILSDLQEKFNAGYVKEAFKEYSDAIKKDPGNSDYWLGRGRCREKMTDESKWAANALKDYSQAIETDPYNLAAIRARAELYAHTGDYFKALSDYKVYLTLDKDNTELYERKSQMHVLLKLPNDAVQDLNEALAIDPRAAHVYLSKGLLLYDQNDVRGANECFTTCLRIDSTNALAWYHRGRCEILLGRVPAAASDFASAREKGLDSGNCKVVAGYAERLYSRAVEKFSGNRLDSAILYIDYSISINGENPLYRFTRGEYYYTKANYNEAIVSYDKAIALNPQYIEAYYKRGMARNGIADYKEAIVNFSSAMKLDAQNFLAQKGEGDARMALKDYSGASAADENALRIAAGIKPPVNPAVVAEIYNALSVAYYEQGDYEKAENNGKNAFRKNPGLAVAYFNTGNAYFKQGQPASAIENITKALSMENDHPGWHYILARSYQDKKDLGNALAQYGACVQQDKRDSIPDAIYRAGYCNYQLQNYTAALPFYGVALQQRLDTGVGSFNIELGVIYLNTGKLDSAAFFYRKAYQKDSTNGYASYGIGASLALMGKTDESFPWFERSFQTKTPSYGEIKKDKLLAEMRNNKKFKELLKKYY